MALEADGRATDATSGGEGDEARAAATTEKGAGWRGWLLVGVVVLALLVVPGLVYWRPPALPFRVAFLALPLVPAFLLGATAVWVALRGRGG